METLKDVCKNVKLMAYTPVAGRKYCRGLYYLLVVAVGLLFLKLAFQLIMQARSKTITSTTFTLQDSLIFPTLWACTAKGAEKTAFSRYDLINPNGSCTLGDTGEDNGKVWGKGMVTDIKGNAECGYWRSGTPFTNTLEEMLEKTNGQGLDIGDLEAKAGYTCLSFNEKGKIKDSSTNPKIIWLEWAIDSKSQSDYLRIGMIQSLRIPDLIGHADHMDVVRSFVAPLSAQNSLVGIYVKRQVDERDANIQAAATSYLRTLVGLKRPSTSIDRYDAETSDYTSLRNGMGSIGVRFASFSVETFTRRYETFDELWSDLGGAWAACALIITMFFFRKTATKEGSVVNHDVMVPRLQDNSDLESLIVEELVMVSKVAGATGYKNEMLVAGAALATDVQSAHKKYESEEYQEAVRVPTYQKMAEHSSSSDSDSDDD
eukprot:TRINITY_DN110389_c0_g1_i1.p1 TRINITY_DN110389_c0_g1~~TRINITY_DN110389_c0_g1_i1.p1  ORF type:complete len:431 (-),score=53.27 TRINITY_DN110389_c0_g1_i1:159-1451(-)